VVTVVEDPIDTEYDPSVFCMFAQAWFPEDRKSNSVISGKGLYDRGDHVELLAHEDLYVSVSVCPEGDFEDVQGRPIEEWTCWPVKVTILEGKDAPLETVPEIVRKSTPGIEFIKAGRPGMVHGRVGDKNSSAYIRS
jgi:hypothetical protein